MILYFLKKNNIFYTTAPYTYKKSENFMKNSLIRGTLILTLAGLITRFIGFFYRIFLANFLGEEQLGIYQLILPLYSICFTIYGAGLQTALSQLISGSKSSRQNGIIKAALVLSISTAVTLSLFVFLKADWLAQKYFHEAQAASLLQILSILFPFCGISSMVNGYFYGKGNAKTPAISQIIEQLARVTFVVCLSMTHVLFMTPKELAVAGIVTGEIVACLFNIRCTRQVLKDKERLEKQDYKDLLKLSLPLTGSRLVISFLSSLESILVPITLRHYGCSSSDSLGFLGILSGVVMPFILFPSALTNSLSVLLLPSISKANSQGHTKTLRRQGSRSIKFSLCLGLLSLSVFANFGKELGLILFHSERAGTLLVLLSVLCPFIYTTTTMESIINGLGKTLSTMNIHLIGLAIRILSLLWVTPHLGPGGYLGGLILSQLVICIICIFYLHHKLTFRFYAGSSLILTFFFTYASIYTAHLLGNLLAEKTGFSYLVFVPLLFFLPGVLLYLARFNEIKWNAILPQR